MGLAMQNEIQFMKQEILVFFKEQQADAGHVIHIPAFLHQRMIHWSPLHKAALDAAIQELAADGVIHAQDQKVCLTATGAAQLPLS
jgi:hypothetical protein